MKVTPPKDPITPNRSHTCRKCASYLEFHTSEAIIYLDEFLVIKCPVCNLYSDDCDWRVIIQGSTHAK